MKMDINYYVKYTIEKYSTLKKYTSINNWHITYSNKTYRIKSITIIKLWLQEKYLYFVSKMLKKQQ